MIRILILFICLFSFFSCKSDKKKVLSEFVNVDANVIEESIKDMVVDKRSIKISINDDCVKKEILLSSVIASIDFIKLESSAEAIIGGIDKILFGDSCMYVLDRNKTKSLKKFAIDGSYICNIGQVGEGPDEYIEPTDFVLFDKHVIVYDQFRCNLNYYDLDGKLVKTRKLPFMCLQFHLFSADNFIFNTLDADNQHLQKIDNYSIFTSDSLFHLKQRGFYRQKDLYSSIFIPSNFNVCAGKLYYHPPFKNTIYSINADGKISTEYELDFGYKELPEEILLTKNWKQFLKESDKGRYYFFPGEYYNVDSLLYFSYIKAHEVYRCFYSISENNLICSSLIKNDLVPIFSFCNIVGADSGSLVGYIFPYEIVRARENCSVEEWRKQVGEQSVEIAASLKEDDNPIIIKYYPISNKTLN